MMKMVNNILEPVRFLAHGLSYLVLVILLNCFYASFGDCIFFPPLNIYAKEINENTQQYVYASLTVHPTLILRMLVLRMSDCPSRPFLPT